MKKLFFLAVMTCSFALAKAQNNPNQLTPANTIEKVLSFKEDDHEMGKIPYGKPIEYDVLITNISKDSVKIDNVQVGCGCTTPKWQAGPYAAGQTFKITLGFNGYTDGHFEKVVTVFFSGGLTKVLKFHGDTFKEVTTKTPGTTK